MKEIAPSPALRKWFGHDPARFEEFAARYHAELAANTDAPNRIDDYLNAGRVTLLYAAHDTIHNHANVLCDYLWEREKGRTHT